MYIYVFIHVYMYMYIGDALFLSEAVGVFRLPGHQEIRNDLLPWLPLIIVFDG